MQITRYDWVSKEQLAMHGAYAVWGYYRAQLEVRYTVGA
jgi:hypothetical protein